MQGAEERRLKRISNTLQGEATEGNIADDILMVDQGKGLMIAYWEGMMYHIVVTCDHPLRRRREL